MESIPVTWFVALSAILFLIGASGVLLRKNLVIMLMSLELIFNAVNINLVAFSYYLQDLTGQLFAIFSITIAACEVAVALGILIALVRNRRTFSADEIKTLNG